MRQTTFAKTGAVEQTWHLVDATDLVVGRLATKLATILQGKHKPSYTPHVDTGDYIVVINADKLVLTGRKASQKFRLTYSGYPGGQHATSFGKLLNEQPDLLLSEAVRRMLPKSDLGRQMLSKLKIYAGPEHPHTAQQPKTLELTF